jgi:hypothetical protein
VANIFLGNKARIDDYSAAIDIGATMFGNSRSLFFISYVAAEAPRHNGITMKVTDQSGNVIFSEVSTSGTTLKKDLYGQTTRGIVVPISGNAGSNVIEIGWL